MFKKRKNQQKKYYWLTVIGFIFAIVSFLMILSLPAIAAPGSFGFEYASDIGLGTRDIRATVVQIINVFLGILGIIAVVIIIYGGYLYMTAAGSPDRVERAKKVLINAVIGLVIILLSFAIAQFIISRLWEATGGPGAVIPGSGICQVSQTQPPAGTSATQGCINCGERCTVVGAPAAGDGTCIYDYPGCVASFNKLWDSPIDNDTGVSLCHIVQAGFNMPVSETSLIGPPFLANIYTATGYGDASMTGTLLPAEVSSIIDGLPSPIVTIVPDDDYTANTWYHVKIDPTLTDESGGYVLTGDDEWWFKTGATPDDIPPQVEYIIAESRYDVWPAHAETDVCLQTYLYAKFNEDMDARTFYSAEGLAMDDIGAFLEPDSDSNNFVFNFQAASADSFYGYLSNPGLLTAGSTYWPELQSHIYRDTCLNYLDSNLDGTAAHPRGTDQTKQAGDDVDDFPDTAGGDDWWFTAGDNLYCTPYIQTISGADYYHDTDIMTIDGHYLGYPDLALGVELTFNSGVKTNSSSLPIDICLAGGVSNQVADPAGGYGQHCSTSNPSYTTVQTKVPAASGATNAAITGPMTVTNVKSGLMSAPKDATITSPYIQIIGPAEGGKQQFVTLQGNNFGASQGLNDHVYFKYTGNPATFVEAVYVCEENGWNDNYIVIAVPDAIDSQGAPADWYIQVVLDETVAARFSNVTTFTYNGALPTPGLCAATNINTTSPYYTEFPPGVPNSHEGAFDPETGVGDRIELDGVRFEDVTTAIPSWNKAIRFGSAESFKETIYNTLIDDTLWYPDLAETDVPNIQSGVNVGVYLVNDPAYPSSGVASNFVPFNVYNLGGGGPWIDYLDPTRGPTDQYVTVWGNNFGETPHKVWFNGVLSGDVEGNFSFPNECSQIYWRNNYIIVKVPDLSGTPPYYEEVARVWVERADGEQSNFVNFNYCVEEPGDAVFCPLLPGLCGMQPDSGPVNTRVHLYGERLSDGTQVNDSAAIEDSVSTTFDSSNAPGNMSMAWFVPYEVRFTVPISDDAGTVDTQDGGASVWVHTGDGTDEFDSNTLPFTIGRCQEFGCSTATDTCCADGSCVVDPSLCPSIENKSAYSWEFSTDPCPTTLPFICDDGSGGDQCCPIDCNPYSEPVINMCDFCQPGEFICDDGTTTPPTPPVWMCCGEPCDPGPYDLCPTGGPVTTDSCSGFDYNMCLETSLCPNQPGNCQTIDADELVVGACDCNATVLNCAGASLCDYDVARNQCFSTDIANDFCDMQLLKTIVVETVPTDFVFTCNYAAGTWQTAFPGGECPHDLSWTTYLDDDYMCALSGVPACANTCIANGYDTCIDDDGNPFNRGVCYSSSQICPGGSICTGVAPPAPSVPYTCEQAGQCACCCEVGEEATQCCDELTCVPEYCISGDPLYGMCGNCWKDINGDGIIDYELANPWSPPTGSEQEASNTMCQCTGATNVYCDLTCGTPGVCEPSLGEPSGICTDVPPTYSGCQGTWEFPACGTGSCVFPDTCQPHSGTCACLPPEPHFGRCINAADPAGADTCNYGIALCGGITLPGGTMPLQCLYDFDSGGGDCWCCCDPATAPRIPLEGGGELYCEPDVAPCTSSVTDFRGLTCGCREDQHCGSVDLIGCATEISPYCCYPRPAVGTTYPQDADEEVCLNSYVEINFTDSSGATIEMDQNTYGNNIYLLYSPDATATPPEYCDEEDYVHEFNWTGFAPDGTAVGPDWCKVKGRAVAVDGDRAAFKLNEALPAEKWIRLFVRSEDSTELGDGIHNVGVESDMGITMAPDVAGLRGQQRMFKTGTEICRVDSVYIEPPYYLFHIADEKADFQAIPRSDTGQFLTTITGVYEWTWAFDIYDPQLAISSLTQNPVDPMGTPMGEDYVRLAASGQNGKGNLNGHAQITVDPVFGTTGRVTSGRADYEAFICENPWPPFPRVCTDPTDPTKPDLDPGNYCLTDTDEANCILAGGICEFTPFIHWGYEDESGNCSVGHFGLSCDDYHFGFAYCRDAGAPGTADDLPPLEIDPLTMGQREECMGPDQSCCTPLGTEDCDSEAGCETCGGRWLEVLKEIWFFRPGVPIPPTWSGDCDTSIVPTPGAQEGGSLTLTWLPDATSHGYKIYVGASSGSYNLGVIEIDNFATTSVVIDNVEGTSLNNGQPYYFAMTTYRIDPEIGIEESPYSEECVGIPVDEQEPSPPEVIAAIPFSDSGEFWWQQLATPDDVRAFIIYYGRSSTVYGVEKRILVARSDERNQMSVWATAVEADRIFKEVVDGLELNTEYFVALRSEDSAGNLSDFSAEARILTGEDCLDMDLDTIGDSIPYEYKAFSTLTPDKFTNSDCGWTGIKYCGALPLSRADDLAGNWNFNDESLTDLGGSLDDSGVIVGTETYQPGRYGHALSLNGASHVNIGASDELTITGDVTVEAWIKPSVAAPSNAAIFSNGGHYWLSFAGGAGGRIRVADTIGNGIDSTVYPTWNTDWHHVVGIVKEAPGVPTDRLIEIWIDGQLDPNTSPAAQIYWDADTSPVATPSTIGAISAAMSHFTGLIADVAVYRRALTPEEIVGHYYGSACGDNCPMILNVGQADADSDGFGDECDNCQNAENGPYVGQCLFNPLYEGDLCYDPGFNIIECGSGGYCSMEQEDSNNNCPVPFVTGTDCGDVCDPDPDMDGICTLAIVPGVCTGANDNCPWTYNPNQADSDGDLIGDVCDTCTSGDGDGDGVCDDIDNCPGLANPTQDDLDGDAPKGYPASACDFASGTPYMDYTGTIYCGGDLCDDDRDGDGEPNTTDNCPNVPNPGQENCGGGVLGDACTTDDDGDGVLDTADNCICDANAGQADIDLDGIGDVCDACPQDPLNDIDGDTWCANSDNCPMAWNDTQTDSDLDHAGCVYDIDGDGFLNDDPPYCSGALPVAGVCPTSRCGGDACDSGICGNGVINVGEECDTFDFGVEDCVSQGFDGGSLSCTGACLIDTSSCRDCGNNVTEGGEVCDGTDVGGLTCVDLGYALGTLGCKGDCSGYDTSACSSCNNGVLDLGEDCDYGADNSCCLGCAWVCDAGSMTPESMAFGGSPTATLASAEVAVLDFPQCRIFDNTSGLIDATLIPDIAVAGNIAIVFVTDSSGSLTATQMADIKQAIKDSIDALYDATAVGVQFHVGLVEFDSAINPYPIGDLAVVSHYNALKTEVDTYVDGGSTYTLEAMQQANTMLNAYTADLRIVILISDGDPTVSHDPDVETDAAKAAGTEIYTIAFTSNPSLQADMCSWSSDNGVGCYSSGYSYSDTDPDAVYEEIIDQILDLPEGPYDITIDGVTVSVPAAGLFLPNIPISFPVGLTCDPLAEQPLNFSLDFTGGGQITIGNARVDTCESCD